MSDNTTRCLAFITPELHTIALLLELSQKEKNKNVYLSSSSYLTCLEKSYPSQCSSPGGLIPMRIKSLIFGKFLPQWNHNAALHCSNLYSHPFYSHQVQPDISQFIPLQLIFLHAYRREEFSFHRLLVADPKAEGVLLLPPPFILILQGVEFRTAPPFVQ